MKKITLLMMLFVASVGMNAQTWDFNNVMEPWENVSASKKLKPEYLELKSKVDASNPGLRLRKAEELAKINTSTVSVLSITLKNKSTTGPNELKVVITTKGSDASGSIRAYADMSTGDSDYQTYYVDLTHSRWVGTVSDIKINFVTEHNQDFTGTGNEVFDIDKIEMLDAIPTTERHDFQFATDGDVEGFKDSNLGDLGAVVSGDQLTLDLTKADSYPNIVQLDYHVVADDYPTLEVSLKNLSPEDDTMTLILDDGTTYSTTISTSNTGFNTYKVKLDTAATWMGEQSAYKIRFGDASRPNPKKPENFGVSSGQGSVVIEYIKFTTEVLSNESITKDDTQLSIYPNPVRNTLSVKASAKINSLQIYNVTGQEVLRSSEATINTSSLTRGVYILRVSQEGGAISTKRFIKE